MLGSRPAIGDFSKFPQGADFSLAETGSILNRGVVESSAEPNLLLDELPEKCWTSAARAKVICEPGLHLLLVLISA